MRGPIELTKGLLLEGRDLPSVAAGVELDERLGSNGRYVAYAPGNGTMYRVLVTMFPIGSHAASDLGATDDSVAVTLVSPRVGFAPLRGNGKLLHHDYVAEKFPGLSGADVVAVTELLGALLDRPTTIDAARREAGLP